MYKCIQGRFIVLLFVFGVPTLTSGEFDEVTGVEVREKRSIVCLFGRSLIPIVLQNALEELNKLDPLDIGDVPESSLKEGELYGLSTLGTVTPIDVSCDDSGDVMVSTTLGMREPKVKYKWKKFKMKGSIWTKVKEMHFGVVLQVVVGVEMKMQVKEVGMTKLEKMRFGFSGLGPLNPLIKGIGSLCLMIWKKKVAKKIEDLLYDALQDQISQLNASVV